MRKLSISVLLLSLATPLFGNTPAFAQDSMAGVTEADKQLFLFGAKLYGAHKYEEAVDAFTKVEERIKKPAVYFSLGQAHRKQYFVDTKPEHLALGISAFKKYLQLAPDGSRVADARQAVEELTQTQIKVGAPTTMAAPVITPKATSYISVDAQVDGAMASVDKSKPKPTPFSVEVKPGPHHVKVQAEGYLDEDRDVVTQTGSVLVSVNLKERPSEITLSASVGAQVSVDGRAIGTTPLLRPLELSPGTHLLTLTKNGYEAFSEDIQVARDEKRTMNIKLPSSKQRRVSFALLGTGSAAFIAGAVFGVIALGQQGKAEDIRERQVNGNITGQDLEDYDRARSSRDDWSRAALITGISGIAVASTGMVLYLFDAPTVKVVPRREAPPKPEPRKAPEGMMMEMGFTPFIAPGSGGAAVFGRF